MFFWHRQGIAGICKGIMEGNVKGKSRHGDNGIGSKGRVKMSPACQSTGIMEKRAMHAYAKNMEETPGTEMVEW